MKRKIYNELLKWKNEKENIKPLIVLGARQVGKTYIIDDFCKNEYENYIYANINQQIFQRRELIIQLNQLLNQCYLGFIKHTVQNFNQRFNTLGINPIINSHINISNI